jgi:cyclophilin family peptidyl-prolyl cis-trans isomerase/HEAT repeat protein
VRHRLTLQHVTVAASALLLTDCASAPVNVELSLDQKLARLLRLEDERSLGGGEIVSRLSDAAPRVRRQAALALARIADPSVAAPLGSVLLQDPDAAVRAMAAFALGAIERDLGSEPWRALESALSDPDAEVRGRAAEALGRIAASGESEKHAATAELLRQSLLGHPPRGTAPFVWGETIDRSAVDLPHPDWRLGLFALVRLRNIDALRSVVTHDSGPRFIWWPAAWSMARLPEPETLPLLMRYVESEDPYLRLLSARGLARFPDLGSPVVQQTVLALLQDRDEKTRIEAVRAAGALRLLRAVPPILRLMSTDTSYVQLEAIHALGQIADASALEPLLDRLSDERAWMRAAAIRAVPRLDRDGFLLLLSGTSPDPDWRVRTALAETLGEMEATGVEALLTQMASDRDYRVRPAALKALARTAAPAAGAVLLRHLQEASEPFERAAAAEGLVDLRPEGAAAALQAAFATATDDDDPAARLAILDALRTIDAEAARMVAKRALDDRSPSVRAKAASLLPPGEDGADPPPGDWPPRSLYEYLDLLHPRYTPQAFIRTEKGVIELELFVLDAPLTVENFMRLARRGFYNGQTFHRVIPNFLVQAGDPRGDSRGGPGYTIRSEINTRAFLRGTVGMAHSGKDSEGSQFFITHLPQPQLDGVHTVFGQVVAGLNLLDRIEPGDLIREIFIWDGTTTETGDSGRGALDPR